MQERPLRWRRWRSISYDGSYFSSIAINDDGSLWNPNGYAEDRVRAAIAWANEQKWKRREEGIRRGVEKRKQRRESRITGAAQKLLTERGVGNHWRCVCCDKLLTDPVSVKRGIGPECWEHVLRRLEELQSPAAEAAPATPQEAPSSGRA
jgi:hypothetical protein